MLGDGRIVLTLKAGYTYKAQSLRNTIQFLHHGTHESVLTDFGMPLFLWGKNEKNVLATPEVLSKYDVL